MKSMGFITFKAWFCGDGIELIMWASLACHNITQAGADAGKFPLIFKT